MPARSTSIQICFTASGGSEEYFPFLVRPSADYFIFAVPLLGYGQQQSAFVLDFTVDVNCSIADDTARGILYLFLQEKKSLIYDYYPKELWRYGW